jgi:hypothetical protein
MHSVNPVLALEERDGHAMHMVLKLGVGWNVSGLLQEPQLNISSSSEVLTHPLSHWQFG